MGILDIMVVVYMLVVARCFLFSFCVDYGHSILYSSNINFLKYMLDVYLGILNIVSIFFINMVCVVALAPAVMTICGSIFQALLVILCINGLYFLFLVIISHGILSLHYVNSMNCIVRFSFGFVVGNYWYGSPFTRKR